MLNLQLILSKRFSRWQGYSTYEMLPFHFQKKKNINNWEIVGSALLAFSVPLSLQPI